MTMQSVFSSRDLAELNEGFLQLVANGADAGLARCVHERLTALDPEARRRLAGVSFALFGFGFQEESAWEPLFSPGVRDLEPGYVARDPAAERFTLLALTALRGFIRVAPQRVSAWIGLPPEMRSRLAGLEIGVLGVVASFAAPRLRFRLAVQEAMWLRFIEASERRDLRHFALLDAHCLQWTIRRALRIEAPCAAARVFRR
jgi:hypothetical protein